MFVDFVRDRQHVELDAQIANQFQFRSREHLSRRVVGRVNDDGLGVLVECRPQFFLIEGPLAAFTHWRTQLHKSRACPAQYRIRPVVLVKRFKDHNLIAGIAHCQQSGDHPLGRPATNRNFFFRIDPNPLPHAHLPRNRIPQVLRSPRDGILIHVAIDRRPRRLLDLLRGRKIRKPLRQVYRLMQHRLPGHLPDHRLGKLRNLVAQKMLFCGYFRSYVRHSWRISRKNCRLSIWRLPNGITLSDLVVPFLGCLRQEFLASYLAETCQSTIAKSQNRQLPFARCPPPNPCSAATIFPDHSAICSLRSVPSSDCSRARNRIEYFPAPIDAPRKISTGLKSRKALSPSPIPACRIAANSTSSGNTNEKSRSTAGYFPNAANRTVRNPRACNCSTSISARKTSCRNFRSAFTLSAICPNCATATPSISALADRPALKYSDVSRSKLKLSYANGASKFSTSPLNARKTSAA